MAEQVVEKMTPERKAAAVIVSLGVDKASQIYKYLGQEDLERLTVEVAKLGHLKAEETENILDEFYKECLTQKVVADGGIEYARQVLEKAFGEETASMLLQKVSKSLKVMPFSFLSKTNSKNLFSILQHERPQTIALVLSYAEPNQAADVIVMLPEEKRLRVVTCIAKMDSASPEAIKLVEIEMQKKFSTLLTTDFTHVGGVDYIAEVINNMDRISSKVWTDRTKNCLQKSARRCSYSKISLPWMQDRSSASCVTATRRISFLHSKALPQRLQTSSLQTYPLVWLKTSSPTSKSLLMSA